MSLTIKNWKKFQHFKDRRPPWIKLYRDLLDDEEFYTLDPLAAKTLILLWLLASEGNGSIPSDMRKLAFRLRLSEAQVTQVMRTLLGAGFILESTGDYEQVTPDHIRKINGFGSRHISDSIKRQVWERDLGKCQHCESVELLEYDHITPTSKGGESVFENIQLLCRSCNRKKRATTAEQVATPAQPWLNMPSTRLNMRNPETETETYKAEAEADCATPSLSVDRIVEVWNMTPRLVPAKSVTGPILKRVKLRLAEHPEVEWWAALFTRVSASDFLTGRKTDFAATLDWVLGPKNLAKIEAGNYDNRDLPPPPRSYEGSYHKKVCL